MELSKQLYDQINTLCENGNRLFEEENLDEALNKYKEALNLLPIPKTDWEAGLWLYTAIGDVFFLKQNYIQAKDSLLNALNSPQGSINPFVLCRLGQTFYELNDFENAKEYMLRAYMLEGFQVFEGENLKYFTFLTKNID